MKKKKILGITGIRSDYDILSSVFKAIEINPNLDLEIIVTGTHLSDKHNHSISEVERDGFRIVQKIDSFIDSDSLEARVLGLAEQIKGITMRVKSSRPDILLVLGDREESIALSLVGSYMNIPIAHICGGDRVVGNVDDQIRHAVSKLSHLHFVSNQESYERLIKMGEQKFRIFNVGNPGLDRLKETPEMSIHELNKNLSIDLNDDEPFIVMIQHVISSEYQDGYFQMNETLKALDVLGFKSLIIYPNFDPGSEKLIEALHLYKDVDHFYIKQNLPRLEFVNLLRKASCLIGNSSAGILESSFLKLPVVNIGNRQKGRLHAENVEFTKHDSNLIQEAIKKALFDEKYKSIVKNCTNPYGNGDSSIKIANILDQTEINKEFSIKDISY